MPRARKPQAPGVRSDGQPTQGNLATPGQGQPNGNRPRSAVTKTLAAAGAGEPMPYGQSGQLQDAAAATPLPPGVTPEGNSARQMLVHHFRAVQSGPKAVTPLFAPTERPFEPVTAGAPLDSGPTNPMALAGLSAPAAANAATILSQAADASGSPQLRALAQRAQAVLGGQPQA